jgi:hypothetical protein
MMAAGVLQTTKSPFRDIQDLIDGWTFDDLTSAAQPMDFNLINMTEPSQSESCVRRRLRKVGTRGSVFADLFFPACFQIDLGDVAGAVGARSRQMDEQPVIAFFAVIAEQHRLAVIRHDEQVQVAVAVGIGKGRSAPTMGCFRAVPASPERARS